MCAILRKDPSSERRTRKRMTNSTKWRTEEYSGSGWTRGRKTHSGKKEKKVDRELFPPARCDGTKRIKKRPNRPLASRSAVSKKLVVRSLGSGGRKKKTYRTSPFSLRDLDVRIERIGPRTRQLASIPGSPVPHNCQKNYYYCSRC